MNSFTITCNCFLLNYILFLTFSFPYSTYSTSPSPIKRTTLLFVLSYYPLNPVFVQIYLTITFFIAVIIPLFFTFKLFIFFIFNCTTVQLLIFIHFPLFLFYPFRLLLFLMCLSYSFITLFCQTTYILFLFSTNLYTI